MTTTSQPPTVRRPLSDSAEDLAIRFYPFERMRLIVLCAVACFVVLLGWAGFATLDEVTRSEGKIIPSREIQQIQHLEGGIVEEILVKPGDVVERDQILMRLQKTIATADYQQARNQFYTYTAMIERLESEISGKEFVVPEIVAKEMPKTAADEMQTFTIRRSYLSSQLGVLEQQLAQRRQEITELKGRAAKSAEAIELARREERMLASLVARGVAAEVDLLRLRRAIVDKEGELQMSVLAAPRAEAAAREVEQRINEIVSRTRSEAAGQMNEIKAKLAAVTETIRAYEDRVTRTELRAPLRGIIKDVLVHTLGGVVKPGEEVIQIVPLEDTLLVEARVRPSDIAFLHPGQRAVVKITAYDFSIYGGLGAAVVDISADTLTNEKEDESFYRVRLRTDGSSLSKAGKELAIIPGMTATVDILTGEKTVLAYLLKPLLKAREAALSER
jgi:adhesin transport system membrane fusion protein